MASTRRKDRNRPDEAIADRLVEAGETLLGLHGIEGVSLRQISVAAGTANNYAVQYHFGDLAGLIRAILAKRMPEIELARATALAQAKRRGALDTRALMDVLYRPLVEHLDASGERAYARFILALQGAPAAIELMRGDFHLMPIGEHVLELLCQQNSDFPKPLLLERHRLISIMVLNSLVDHRPAFGMGCEVACVDNVLDMAASALVAPMSASLRDLIKRSGSKKGG